MAEWHLITGEFPPQSGGVSDYTSLVVNALAAAGDSVHVWCPPAAEAPSVPGVTVHQQLGRLTAADLRHVARELDCFPAPRKLLIQWVPHSFGRRSLNLAFCLWLWKRAARRGDLVEIMVHEPFLSFRRWEWRRNAAAAVQRIMTAILLRAAEQVWVAAPLWADWWRPYGLGRSVPYTWLPVPSNLPVVDDPRGSARLRNHYLSGGSRLVGHFGTYGPDIGARLMAMLPPLLLRDEASAVLLLGRGGKSFREEMLRLYPSLEGRIHATGGQEADQISRHLRSVDLLIQPYPAGVNARRGSILAGLAHGVAVVTTAGWLTEPFWSESGAVALVPDEDPAAMIDMAGLLLSDSSARKRLETAATALYRRQFALRHTIQSLRRERCGDPS